MRAPADWLLVKSVEVILNFFLAFFFSPASDVDALHDLPASTFWLENSEASLEDAGLMLLDFESTRTS